jgi:hypothetical protein
MIDGNILAGLLSLKMSVKSDLNSSNLRPVIILIPPSYSPPSFRFWCTVTTLLKVLCAITEYLNCARPVLAGVDTDRS